MADNTADASAKDRETTSAMMVPGSIKRGSKCSKCQWFRRTQTMAATAAARGGTQRTPTVTSTTQTPDSNTPITLRAATPAWRASAPAPTTTSPWRSSTPWSTGPRVPAKPACRRSADKLQTTGRSMSLFKYTEHGEHLDSKDPAQRTWVITWHSGSSRQRINSRNRPCIGSSSPHTSRRSRYSSRYSWCNSSRYTQWCSPLWVGWCSQWCSRGASDAATPTTYDAATSSVCKILHGSINRAPLLTVRGLCKCDN